LFANAWVFTTRTAPTTRLVAPTTGSQNGMVTVAAAATVALWWKQMLWLPLSGQTFQTSARSWTCQR
jgi:hypothetical protein